MIGIVTSVIVVALLPEEMVAAVISAGAAALVKVVKQFKMLYSEQHQLRKKLYKSKRGQLQQHEIQWTLFGRHKKVGKAIQE